MSASRLNNPLPVIKDNVVRENMPAVLLALNGKGPVLLPLVRVSVRTFCQHKCSFNVDVCRLSQNSRAARSLIRRGQTRRFACTQ
mgnify:CR=1 FL=1